LRPSILSIGHLQTLLYGPVAEEGFLFESAAYTPNLILNNSEFVPLIPEKRLDCLMPNAKIVCSLSGDYLWLIHQLFSLHLNQTKCPGRRTGMPSRLPDFWLCPIFLRVLLGIVSSISRSAALAFIVLILFWWW
jgi:hypothetical protein